MFEQYCNESKEILFVCFFTKERIFLYKNSKAIEKTFSWSV